MYSCLLPLTHHKEYLLTLFDSSVIMEVLRKE